MESGHRRPGLELLLPLARAYQIPIEELIGAPTELDPRVYPQPFTRNGMTVVPLTRKPGGLQAFKHIPTDRICQEQRGTDRGKASSGSEEQNGSDSAADRHHLNLSRLQALAMAGVLGAQLVAKSRTAAGRRCSPAFLPEPEGRRLADRCMAAGGGLYAPPAGSGGNRRGAPGTGTR
ncbi:hypothetical protein [Streptomyces sp. M1013]|uniref:hypothetical protein n=1 Tax=Streptomyces sp. M1013 TaxID=549798 RepID=UPI00345C528C